MSETGGETRALTRPEHGRWPAPATPPWPTPATGTTPVTPGADPSAAVPEPGLAAVARRVAEGNGRPAELFEVFLDARVFCARPERPGFLAVDDPDRGGGRLVAVFSSLAEFGAFSGGGDWFSLRGADLLDLLPPGHVLLLDPAGTAPLRLDPAASRVDPSRSLVFDHPDAAGRSPAGRSGGPREAGR